MRKRSLHPLVLFVLLHLLIICLGGALSKYVGVEAREELKKLKYLQKAESLLIS